MIFAIGMPQASISNAQARMLAELAEAPARKGFAIANDLLRNRAEAEEARRVRGWSALPAALHPLLPGAPRLEAYRRKYRAEPRRAGCLAD